MVASLKFSVETRLLSFMLAKAVNVDNRSFEHPDPTRVILQNFTGSLDMRGSAPETEKSTNTGIHANLVSYIWKCNKEK